MASNISNVINSNNTTLLINNLSSSPVTIGSGGGLTTITSGLTSTAGTTTLGVSTIGAITGTSATFSSTLNVTGLITASGGINTGSNASTFNSISATTGTFSGLLTASNGFTSTIGTNNLGSTTFAGSKTINFGGNILNNAGTPSISTDIATKGYVDSVAQGLNTKQAVYVATTVAGTLSTSFTNGQVIDGITLITGYRILIKNQTNGIENGIYTINASGSPTRSLDMATGSHAGGSYVFIQNGTTNINQGFVCTNTNGVSDVVDTNILSFTQFTGVADIIAGTGILTSGNTISINPIQTSLQTITLVTGGSGLNATAVSTNLKNTTFAPSSTISIGNNLLSNVSDPVSAQDSVTLNYLNNYYSTVYKTTVIVATVVAGTLTTSFSNGQIVDGITLVTGNRILIKNQSNPIENGVYIVTTGTPTRVSSFASGLSVSGAIIPVLSGNTNNGLYFICTNNLGSDIVGTNSLTFLASILAGTGLTNTGTTLNVNASQTQITSVGTLTSLSVIGNVQSGSLTVNGVNLTPNSNDIKSQLSFTSSTNPVATATNVTGLLVSNTNTRTFKALVAVTVSATTNVYQLYELIGINNATGWFFNQEVFGTVSTGVTFSITSGGQVQYTQTAVTGHTLTTMKFKLDSITV